MLTKIRILFLILTLSLMGTALTIRYTITDEDTLELDERKLTRKIHQYEDEIDRIWNDSLIIKTFQHADKYPIQLSNITSEYAQEFIYFSIYNDNQIVHWSTNIYVPVSDVGLRNTTSIIQTENRSFLTKKKDLDHGISVLALVPIKRNFENTNQFLSNNFLTTIGVHNLEIAGYDDNKNIRNIYSKDGTYLFSVKLIEGKKDNLFMNLQFFCWIAAWVCLIILANSICVHLAKNGKTWLGIILFAAVLIAVRYLDLKSNWLSINSSFELFDPKHYAYNQYIPDIWSFLMISVLFFWFICFIMAIQRYFLMPHFLTKRTPAIVISVLGILSVYLMGHLIYYFLGTLITHSSLYQNDFTKVLNLGFYGWLCILLFCINVTALVLYIDRIVQMIRALLSNITQILNIELICLVFAIIASALMGFSILFGLLFGILVFLRTYKVYHFGSPYQLSTFILTVLILSFISIITSNHYNDIKKTERMEQAISHLLAEDDVNAVSLFIDLEENITNDTRLSKLFSLHSHIHDADYITDYIKTRYMSGYLSRFEFQAFYYDNEGHPLENYAVDKPMEYRENVIKSAIKIPFTANFYRLRGELGTHEYFTHVSIPYEDNADKFHHVYINLKNLAYSTSLPYPEVLADNSSTSWQFDVFENNSYALYKGNNLVTQYGSYSYTENDLNIPSRLREYIPLEEKDNHYHLAYKPDQYTTIVLSSQKTTFWEYLALASIIFIILLTFFGLFNFVNYLIKTFSSIPFRWNRVQYHFRILFSNIQYSTRIQALVSASVLLGTLISGAVAFISLSRQLEETTTNNRLKEVAEITKKIENYMGSYPVQGGFNEKIIETLKEMAPSSMTNFNLYDRSGKLIYSSQQRIFDLKLISEFMNPNALNKLAVLRKSEAYERERISNFWFSSVYAPIKHEDYSTAAYLNIPYYTTEKDASNNKNLLLNTILNIYTFIIILFGFITVTLSRKITKPLDIVRMKLAQTQLSNKVNEPLYWHRNDEIGMLIKEYNHMLIKLEESAKQLRDVERETAWREMAKQVAHEIKNPLTPMKLGVQQLMRSYNENDNRFEERFQRVSASIIEQIDILSKIATEFSAFAKLPETSLVKIDLIEKIQKAMNLFNNTHHTAIVLINKTPDKSIYVLGDRDQFLRTFNNLFKNAIEASVGRKRTRINITVSYPEQAENEGEWVEVLIQDNGFGISEDVIPNIFKPNFTTKSSGTGLGLAFVKQTVTGIGGKIDFITKENVGTTFIIKLPVYSK